MTQQCSIVEASKGLDMSLNQRPLTTSQQRMDAKARRRRLANFRGASRAFAWHIKLLWSNASSQDNNTLVRVKKVSKVP